MKKLSFLLFILSQTTFAQEVTIKCGTGTVDAYATVKHINWWFGKPGDYHLISAEKNMVTDKATIANLDQTMGGPNVPFSLPGVDGNQWSNLYKTQPAADGYTIMAGIRPKESNNTLIYKMTMDSKGNISKPSTPIATSNRYMIGLYSSLTQSQDGSRMAVYDYYSDTLPYNKNTIKEVLKKNKHFAAIVLDKEYNVLNNINIELPYTAVEAEELDVKIDNEGNIFLLNKIRRGGEFVDVVLIKADGKSASSVAIQKIDDRMKYVFDINLTPSTEGNIYITGRYGKKEDSYSAEGMFVQKINTTSAKAEPWVAKNFNTDLKALSGDSYKGFHINTIVKTSAGNYFLTGECNFCSGGGLAKPNLELSNNYGTSSYWEDIFAIKVNALGNIENVLTIPKDQASNNQIKNHFYGSTSLVNGNRVYYLFNDNETNIEKRKAKQGVANYSADPGKSVAIIATFDLDMGLVTEKKLNEYCPEAKQAMIIPAESGMLDKNTIMLKMITADKKNRVASVTVN